MTTDNTIELSFYPNGQLSKATAHGTAADYLPAILAHLLGTAEPEPKATRFTDYHHPLFAINLASLLGEKDNEAADAGVFIVSYLDDTGDAVEIERVEGERAAIVARARQGINDNPNDPYAAVDIHRLGERVSHIKRRPKAADDDAFDSFVMALTRQAAISSATATNMNKVAQKQTDSVTHKFVIGEGWLAEFNKRGYGNAL
jgi:hypothetical protein